MNSIFNHIVQINLLPSEIVPFLQEIFTFPPETIVRKIENYLDSLRKDLFVFIEFPYVDRVYRDSYYSYFSTKRRIQERDCVRLSIFDREISKEHFREPNLYEDLENGFLGFIIIRPTMPNIFGRSMLSPRALVNRKFSSCLVEVEVLVNGRKLLVKAFPHSSQDTETISCAETTILNILEYFGNKYPEYKPVLPSRIIDSLSEYSYQRQIPSHGLWAEEISFALKKLGFGVRVYAKGANGISENELRRIFYYYVESGIPFIAMMENQNIGHAFVVIGHENIGLKEISEVTPIPIELPKNSSRKELLIADIADFSRKYITIDDNFPPYQLVNFEKPAYSYGMDNRFKDCKIHSIIVPLYQKVYLEAYQAQKLVFSILKQDIMSKEIFGEVILRLQLTSSRSFKHMIAVNNSIHRDVRDKIIISVMAKFIWVAEISTKGLFTEDKGICLIVLDATEANENSFDALLFMLHSNKFITLQNRRPKAEEVQFSDFTLYHNNLTDNNIIGENEHYAK
jgi:hypothetical protein